MATIASRIKEALRLRDMRQADLVAATRLTKTAISAYVLGKYEPKQPSIYKIAKALNVSEAWLMGCDVPMRRVSDIYNPSYTASVPILGVIHCGEPVLCDENIEGYVTVPDGIRCDYALRCKGDSMIDAGIADGDIVYIRQQEAVETGEIAAVMVDGETTLKRVYVENGTISLMPANPAFAPRFFSGEAAASVRVIGKAVGFTHYIEK